MKKLFGTDGIRGEAYKFPIDFDTIYRISNSFHKICKPKKILIANDGRESSKMITEAIFSALGKKIEIINLGILTTSATGLIAKETKNYAIVISASHNPATDNGIKIINDFGLKISPEIENLIEKSLNYEEKIEKIDIENNKIDYDNYKSIYKKLLIRVFSENHKQKRERVLNIAIDCANGASSCIISDVVDILKEFKNIDIAIYNDKPNGQNINEKCGATDISFLKLIHKNNPFDIGFSIDGDGDRLIAIDKDLNILDGDNILAIFAKYYKEIKNSSCEICGTIMSNAGLEEFVNKIGLNFKRVDVGDKNIQDFIIKNNTSLGSEPSGHIIIGNYNITGDAILAMLLIIAIINSGYINESEIFKLFQKYPSFLKNYSIPNDIEDSKIINLQETLNTKFQKQDIRILIRKSGTENKIRLLLESKNESDLSLILNEIDKQIKNIID